MEFKYKTKFSSDASYDFGKLKEAKAKRAVFASASLDDLRSLLPDSETIGDNPDLLYTSFNAAVVNLINANDHGIATDAALAVSKYFVDRHMNVEHSRYDVVGHIISQGFSSFGDNKIMTAEELAGTTEPFNICLGAVVYKIVREYMAEIIALSSDKNSEYHEHISTSWEIGFNEFDIVLGSKKISDAEVITDPEKVKEYTPYLRMEGGSGFLPDGTPVYCLIKGDARPLGCAFTSHPAAAVTGVFVASANEGEEGSQANASTNLISISAEDLQKRIDEAVEEAAKEAKTLEAKASENENADNLDKKNKNHSQKENKRVIKNMKLKSTDEITPEFLQTAEASDVRDFIKTELEKTSSEFVEKIASIQTEKDTVDATLATTNKTLSEVQANLEKLQKQVEAKEKQEAFDSRMDEIAATYELDEKQTASIASQIKDLDSAGYDSWKTSFGPFLKAKAAKTGDEEEKSKEAAASAALKGAEASDKQVIPNSTSPEVDELAKLVSGLVKGITINQ